jgi:hypothetical protein
MDCAPRQSVESHQAAARGPMRAKTDPSEMRRSGLEATRANRDCLAILIETKRTAIVLIPVTYGYRKPSLAEILL